MMWPLLAASIVTIAIAVERTVFYRRSASDMQVLQGEFLSAVRAKDFDAAAALCKKAGGTVGAVLEKAIAERNAVINAEQYLSGAAAYSAARLKDHLNYVSAIVTLAPLMGLLGTVTGMIRSLISYRSLKDSRLLLPAVLRKLWSQRGSGCSSPLLQCWFMSGSLSGPTELLKTLRLRVVLISPVFRRSKACASTVSRRTGNRC